MIGGQSFTYQTSNPSTALARKNIPVPLTYTETTLYGSLQPLGTKETVSNIDYTINLYRFITNPTPVALKAKATDRLVDTQGGTGIYRVIGGNTSYRVNGAPHHVEIMMEQPSGLNASPSP